MLALDLFSGPRGWDVHDAELGIASYGVENDDAARATAEAAGFGHSGTDVQLYELERRHDYTGLKASPPCPTFSAAGNGDGRKSLELIREELYCLRYYGGGIAYENYSDLRTGLVAEPFKVILRALAVGRPFRWIVLEQVPGALPVWQMYAGHLRSLSYSVAAGNLYAEQYGVPQTRKRAVLMASLDRDVALPVPTHSKYHNRTPERLDTGVLPWVSMATALGRGLSERPSPTVTGGGTATGGAEPIAKWEERWASRPDWVMGDMRNSHGASGERVTVQEAAILQAFPADYPWQGSKSEQYQQVGNAIPPLLAKAILEAVI